MYLSITFVAVATIILTAVAVYMTFNEDKVADKIINHINKK